MNQDNKNQEQDNLRWQECLDEMKSRISQVCVNEEASELAMRHCLEIVNSDGFINLDYNDVKILLKQEGMLDTFEVSVNQNEPNRVGELASQMKARFDTLGDITSIMINFYVPNDCDLKMEELQILQPVLSSVSSDCDVIWGVSSDDRCTEPILRAIVLVMHKAGNDGVE